MERVEGWDEEVGEKVAEEDAAINSDLPQTWKNKCVHSLNESGGTVMPGFNGTGPEGNGPMTGGGRGRCTPTSQQTYGNTCTNFGGWHRGQGRSGGRDRLAFAKVGGRRSSLSGINAAVDELEAIKAEAAALENSLKKINERIHLLQQQEDTV